MRLALAVTLSFITLGVFSAACSEQGSASQSSNAIVKITVSSMFLTVRNDAGMPLTDVTVSIVPLPRTTVYTMYFGRLENAESRDIMLGEFRSTDGTPFSLRATKPKSVEVKGTDITGKAFTASMPWTQSN